MLPPLHPSNPASLEGLLLLQQHVGAAPCSPSSWDVFMGKEAGSGPVLSHAG